MMPSISTRSRSGYESRRDSRSRVDAYRVLLPILAALSSKSWSGARRTQAVSGSSARAFRQAARASGRRGVQAMGSA